MLKVCVIEDDENIRDIVIYALRSAGFDAIGFETGAEFFVALGEGIPSLVLLDIMLPGDDGLTILKRLRSESKTKKLPVIMLTAKNSEYDKVKGLDMGADDYISKPFSVMELISRVNAVMRRSMTEHGELMEFMDLSLDNARREVYSCGESVKLTFKEYELLYCLMLNAGFVLSRDKIMEIVWGYDFEGESRTVDMHIKTLRQKLGTSGKHIKTVRNVGYKLCE
ncbi:MAG: response regulator transcription factor [Oscillospiraceae bacterium]|nr:response regulator transcription factor [Oscillospiraceae bacterium]